jgi:hypothetical protein
MRNNKVLLEAKLLLFVVVAAGSALGQSTTPASSYQPAQSFSASYHPITREERLKWFVKGSFGVERLSLALVTSGIDTWRNSPEEYGPHWEGFGKRYASRVGEAAISRGIEASTGALWGEDPRYFRVPDRPFGARLRNVVKMTFVSHDRSGHEMPAYARFVAVPSAAFIADSWRPPSQQSATDTLNRIGFDFSFHMLGNAYREFWPDLRRHLPGHSKSPVDTQDSLLAPATR